MANRLLHNQTQSGSPDLLRERYHPPQRFLTRLDIKVELIFVTEERLGFGEKECVNRDAPGSKGVFQGNRMRQQ